MPDLRDQRFGIEIELTGITREGAAQVIGEYFNTTPQHIGGTYDTYSAKDLQNRTWKCVSDSSINEQVLRNGRMASASRFYQTEVVSPICKYEDIETIQELIRLLRGKGAIANASCGIHVHIDASPYDADKLRNLTNIMASKEDLIYKALGVSVTRQHRWCRPVEERFLRELNEKRPRTKEQLNQIWYNGNDRSYNHYDDSRYHALNLHSVFQKGTVEFRLFNGTTHAGKIKTYIQFCLAVSNQALSQNCARQAKTVSSNEKYTFRTWLLRLGMIGDEFATARKFLLKNLEGNIAWRDPAQAEAQRERLAQRREEQAQENQEQTAATAVPAMCGMNL